MKMDGNTRAGMASGTMLVLLFKIDGEELLSTIILAVIGAIASFGASKLLEYFSRRKPK
jgi:hypothetical protein